jgi:glycosyltransferase involved in cell wall biosynthesis
MRIALLLSTALANGAARHCQALAAGLAGRGHDVLLIHRPGLDASVSDAAGVRREVSSFLRTPAEISRVRRLIKAHGTEVMHTHMSSAHAMGAILRLSGGPPLVATAHARHVQLHWAVNDLVLAFTEKSATYHRRFNLVQRRRLLVIPAFLGVQWSEPPTAERRAEARQRLGIPQDAFVVGQVGDVNFDKRQSDMILASHRLMARRPEAMVVMMGTFIEPKEAARVNRAVKGFEDRVVRFERGGDIRDVMHALDIFVISSRREELPTVGVEAMAAGLPMVSTRVGRIQHLLGESGAGLLVKPGDVEAMGEAIEQLADDPELRRKLGAAARARALVEQDSERAIGQIEAALARVARPARRRGDTHAGAAAKAHQ